MSTTTDTAPATPDTLTEEDRANLEAARALILAGVPVFVAPPNPRFDPDAPATIDGRRNPAAVEFHLPKGWQRTAADVANLEPWRPGWALCVVTGHGLDGIDIDPKHGADVATEVERARGLGVVILGATRTPSVGAHLYVRSAGIPNKASTSAGVDYRGGVKGQGSGFLYLPGTRRPRYAGQGYAWVMPLGAADLEDLDAGPDEADAVAAYLEAVGIDTSPTPVAAEVVPANLEALPVLPGWLADELADLGESTAAGTRWRDKDGQVALDRSGRFYRLTAMCHRAGLTQAQAVAALSPWCAAVDKYRGREAEEVARAWGRILAEGEHTPGASSKPRAAVRIVREDPPGTSSHDVAHEGEEWEDPLPFGTPVAAAVPLDGLPDYLRHMVEAVAEQAQAPTEIALAAALGTLAAATRGAWDVRVSESWNAGPTCLWFLTLASSGERKDAASKPTMEALYLAERAEAKQARADNRTREAAHKRILAKLKEAEAHDDAQRMDELTAELWEHRPRIVPQLILSDTTTEAAGMHMAEQGGALAIFGTEASALQSVAGRYSDAGGNFGLLNRAYDAEPYADRRIKRESIRVDRPTLTWAIAVQPEVVAGYATSDAEGSGFLARFALLMPESKVGKRKTRSTPVPASVAERWRQVVGRLYSAAWHRYSTMCDGLPDELGDPGTLTFTDEAADLLYAYAERLEAENTPGSALRSLGGWTAKHPARLARIAAVLALADNPHREDVPAEHVAAALSLGDALTDHALTSLGTMRTSITTSPPAHVLDALRRIGRPEVATREVERLVREQAWAGRRTEPVREALDYLADLGYIRGPYEVTSPKGGRPSERWEVHPSVIAPE